MDLTQYVDTLRHELGVAAEAGGEETRAVAERLTAPLDSATRLVLLDALSAASDEITRELAPGSVEVRLRGRDPQFVVTPPPAVEERPAEVPESGSLKSALASAIEVSFGVRPAAESEHDDEGGGTSRVTLRLPEHLKARVDEAAGREGLSVNAWLVRAVAAACEVEAAPSTYIKPPENTRRRYTGWAR